jgi:hypothetical protein
MDGTASESHPMAGSGIKEDELSCYATIGLFHP